jgi:hypothetical protein
MSSEWLAEHVVPLVVLAAVCGGLSVTFGLMAGYAGHREAVAAAEAAAKAEDLSRHGVRHGATSRIAAASNLCDAFGPTPALRLGPPASASDGPASP